MNSARSVGLTGAVLALAIVLALAALVTTSNTPVLANSAPDLEVGTPSVNDATLYSGNQFTLSVTVTNAGDAQSEATTLRYYRSTDSTITTSDTAQGSESVVALAAAGASVHWGGMTAPTEAGTYYYGACVDSVTGESDTTDNCSLSVTVTVSEPAPDLAVLGIDASDGVETGESFRIGVTVQNLGDGQSAATTLRWLQVTTGASDTELGTDAIRALNLHQANFETIRLTAPPTPGTYTYKACVDSVAGESDTTNNCRSVAITLTNNLATGAPTISGTAQVGQTLTASTSGIADADGLTNPSYSYQWLADDTEIDGATSSTYIPQASDNGKVIKVRVSFADDKDNDESLTSAGTSAVVMAVVVTSNTAIQADSGSTDGICDRTQQVRDAIVATLPNVSDCANVTDTDLSRIYGYLDLENSGITELKSGDFQGLSRLGSLKLSRNSLSELPDGVFDDLGDLDVLYLDINHLSELPDDVFDDLTNLGYLNLGNNGLGELPAGVFDNLSNLVYLYLGFRWEHNIPDATVYPENTLDDLPAGALGNLSKLRILSISDNNLSVLPKGVFTGLTDLVQVNLIGNPGATFTVTANLEQDGDDAVVVKVTEGAPFDMLVTLSAEGGTLSATTVTVEGGSDSSEPVTVTATGEEGAEVTVNVDSAVFQNYLSHNTRAIQAGTGTALTLAQNSPATGAPTISGTAQVGQTLTASTSGIADADGLTNPSYSYQWLADDTAIIDGATSLHLHTWWPSDEGKTIKVKVSPSPTTRTTTSPLPARPRRR